MKLMLGLTIYSKKSCFYDTMIIRKLLETSGNQLREFPAGFQIFLLVFFLKKIGNLQETDALAFWRFPAGFRILYH